MFVELSRYVRNSSINFRSGALFIQLQNCILFLLVCAEDTCKDSLICGDRIIEIRKYSLYYCVLFRFFVHKSLRSLQKTFFAVNQTILGQSNH